MNFQKIMKYAGMILLVIVGIYIFKWINSQYTIPVVGTMIESV